MWIEGQCLARSQCQPGTNLNCPANQTCQADAGCAEVFTTRCVPNGCQGEDVPCPGGRRCHEGQCLVGCDAEEDCPAGQACRELATFGRYSTVEPSGAQLFFYYLNSSLSCEAGLPTTNLSQSRSLHCSCIFSPLLE